jgi:hypothetical protein
VLKEKELIGEVETNQMKESIYDFFTDESIKSELLTKNVVQLLACTRGEIEGGSMSFSYLNV